MHRGFGTRYLDKFKAFARPIDPKRTRILCINCSLTGQYIDGVQMVRGSHVMAQKAYMSRRALALTVTLQAGV